MKIKSVTANNRKKAFEVSTARETYSFPYALLRVQPTPQNRVEDVRPDDELGSEAFTYRLAEGQEDTIHLDAVLEYNRDPSYLKDLLLHRLTVEAQKAVESTDLSKREPHPKLGHVSQSVLPTARPHQPHKVRRADARAAPPARP